MKGAAAAQEFWTQTIEDKQLPGVQYVVVGKDGVVFEFYGGQGNIAAGQKVTPGTMFLSSSTSKVVTALAVLQLADRGTLSLDDPLSKLFDEHPYGDELTLRQLIVHTSGVPNPAPFDWFHGLEAHENFDERAALAKELQDNNALKSKPGEKYRYTNLGYWLLSMAIESASKQSYCDYVREQIMVPLDISENELGCSIPPLDRYATGYVKRISFLHLMLKFKAPDFVFGERHGRWRSFQPLYMNGPGYGGLIGTAQGWGKLLMDLLADDPKVFSKQMREQLYAPQKRNDGKQVGMTLGFHTGTLNNHGYYSKPGGGPGYSSNIRIYPSKGLVTVWLSNRLEFSESHIQKLSDSADVFYLE